MSIFFSHKLPDMEASAKYFSFVSQRVTVILLSALPASNIGLFVRLFFGSRWCWRKNALTAAGREVQADNFGLILPSNVYNSFSLS